MYGLLKNEIEGSAPEPILALDPEFGDLELELTSVKTALDQADFYHAVEVRKLDAAIALLYANLSAFSPFTIADEKTADTVALSLLRDANRTKAGAATAAELETSAAILNARFA